MMNDSPGSTQRLCPVCAKPLPPDAPGGLCPACLGHQGRTREGSPLPLRDLFPDHELLGEIASGGMGVVYLARQISLNRPVALKMIRAGRLATPTDVLRFRTEAEAAAHLDHPNIVPIYEVGEHDGHPFFTMKLIEGGNLAELNAQCASRAFPWLRRAARWVAVIARAVQHAHQRGVLHRDLKPTNILIDDRDEPHLTDFGLAKRLQDATGVTQTMSVLGTPGYMAPEQAAGKARELTTAADIYSLGAILFELATGRPPFTGESALDILKHAATEDPPRPGEINSAVDLDLETICARCLEKEPARRYGTAEELAADLDRWLAGKPIQARPVTGFERAGKWIRRNPLAASLAGTAALILIAGALAVLVQWRRAEQNSVRAEHRAAENREQLVRLNIANGAVRLDAGDPFTALVWFAEAMKLDGAGAARERSHRVRFASVEQDCPRLLNILFTGREVHHAEFSPDGAFLLASSGSNAVHVWRTESGEPAGPVFTHDDAGGEPCVAHFGPGHAVVSANGRSVKVWRIGAPHQALTWAADGVREAVFSRDGAWIGGASANQVLVWNRRNGERHEVARGAIGRIRHFEFSPDSTLLLIAAQSRQHSSNFVSLYDIARREPVFAPIHVRSEVRWAAFSPDGSRFATAHADGSARIWRTEGGAPVTGEMKESTWLTHVAFSPDGTTIATSAGGHVARLWNAASGKKRALLGGHKSVVVGSSFSRDGGRILTRSFDGTVRIHDRTGRRLGPPILHGGLIVAAQFHPDSQRFFTASANGTVRLWSLRPPSVETNLFQNGAILDITRDGRSFLMQDMAGAIHVWDARMWKPASPTIQPARRASRGWMNANASRAITASRADDAAAAALEVCTWNMNARQLLSSVMMSLTGDIVNVTASHDLSQVALLGSNHVDVRRTGDGQTVFQSVERATIVQFSPDGTRLVTVQGANVRLHAISPAPLLLATMRHSADVVHVEFSRDGRRIVSCAQDTAMAPREARIWDAATGAAVSPPMWHADGIFYAAFSPDARLVATAGEDDRARVWDATTGQPLTPPLRHATAVKSAVFSSDNRWIATASMDASARVWDARTGEPVTAKLRTSGPARFAVFVADNNTLLTAAPGEVVLWRLPLAEGPWADLLADAALLTGHELDSTGELAPMPVEKLRALWMKHQGRWRQPHKSDDGGAH